MDVSAYLDKAVDIGSDIGLKVVGAILLWIVGRFLIRLVAKLCARAASGKHLDPTVGRYLVSFIQILLNIVLVIAVLGVFGVQTTSLAAVIAAAGVAVGMAWSGLLANFAAGVFMLILRPFRVGDFVQAGGVTGTVQEIGILVTVIDTLDNIRTIVGNNKVFSETISNYSENDYRRVELTAQLNHTVNAKDAADRLRRKISAIPGVLSMPAPDIEILEFNLAGPVLAVRPYCTNEDYWDVYFATNMAIRDAFGEAKYPVPENHHVLRQVAQIGQTAASI